jgi:signal transduction histidine kinase
MHVASRRREAFGLWHKQALGILAQWVAASVENARLCEEISYRSAQLAKANLVGHELTVLSDPSCLPERVVETIRERFGYYAVHLLLADADKNDLVLSEASGPNAEPIKRRGLRLKVGQEGIVGWVAQTGKAFLCNDVSQEPRFYDEELLPETRAEMAVPLVTDSRIIGVLDVQGDQRGVFDEASLDALQILANQVAVAIMNARMYVEVKDFNQALAQEVEKRTQELVDAQERVAAQAIQLRSLLTTTVHIQQEERARIARDMHDGVIQLSTAARYELQAASTSIASGAVASAEEKIDAARNLLKEIEEEIRRAIHNLHPPILGAVGLVSALQSLAKNFQEVSKIKCQLQIEGEPYRLHPQTEAALFRVVQEALQNVGTHARAKTAGICLGFRSAELLIAVEDDGEGFDYQQWIESPRGEHLGLLAMSGRVESLGGRIEISSEQGQGTRVTLEVPTRRG